MPVVEVRDSIEGAMILNDEGFGYMTRRINLQEGHKFAIQSIDIFNDNGMMPLKTDPQNPANAAYQMFVSPYPMQVDGSSWGPAVPNNIFASGGQSAGEPNVLYKEVGISTATDDDVDFNDKVVIKRFPNDCVAATPTFTWFTPHVYLTVMVWNTPQTEVYIKLSCYMKVKQTKANAVSSSMGCYSELLDSQMKKLVETANVFDPADVAGYTFPSWKFGGIRPELMLNATTTMRYFNRVASNASQEMVESSAMLTAFRGATKMVAFDEAFGDAANNLPEWITLLNVQGVTSGIIRPYPPPLKFADNGNTLMF
jgi:hypothetical protein